MEKLQNRGVSAILDYAAEDDVGACPAPTRSSKPPDESLKGHPTVVKGTENKEAVARVYDYGSEAQCDRYNEWMNDGPSLIGIKFEFYVLKTDHHDFMHAYQAC